MAEGIKIIFKYIKPYKNTLIFLSVLSVVSAVANATLPYLFGRLIDAITNNKSFFIQILLFWFGIKIITDTVDWQIGKKSNEMEVRVGADYLSGGFGKVLEFPIKFHKEHKAGDIGDKISRASGQLGVILSRVIIDLAPQFLSIIFALTVIFIIKPLFGAILVAALLLYILVIRYSTSELSTLYKKGHRAYNTAYGDAYDAIFNVMAIKQATAELFEQRKIHKDFSFKAAPLWIKASYVWQQLAFGQKVLISITQFSIFLYSFYLMGINQITIGELVMFNAYATMLFGPFAILARNWNIVQSGIAALKITEKILASPTEDYNSPDSQILPDIKGGIVFKNVSFSYSKKQPVLNDISFEVKPGEKIAFVGESGVGKSTLINLMSFYYPPTSGNIFIDGVNIKDINLRSLREQTGIVPQEVVLFNDTIKNNIRYGNFRAKDEEVIAASKRSHSEEFIAKFPLKYNQIVGERGIKLSVGQKQRVAIARAILRNPKILILDEPTSALDSKTEKLIQESLNELMSKRTTFIVAHRLSTVRKADKILVFENGRIIESGSYDELISRDSAFRKFYDLQMGLV